MKTFLPGLVGLFLFAPMAASATQITSAHLPSAAFGTPAYLYIPAIKLMSPVQGVGIDSKGRMDVPSGKTKNVGWYKYGTVPGQVGTAVLDAHNTAAFKTLDKVPVGSDIWVMDTKGNWRRFSVTKERTYLAATTPSSVLFEKTTAKQLNLITCAGTLLGNGEATHRLIVSAKLAA